MSIPFLLLRISDCIQFYVGQGSWRKEATWTWNDVGSQPSGAGPAEYSRARYSGIDPLFQPPDPARVTGAAVTFEPGARTAWHAHPLGKTSIVTAGCGRAQRVGGPIEEIRARRHCVVLARGEALARRFADHGHDTHHRAQEKLDGKNVEWMEQVTDEQVPGLTCASSGERLRDLDCECFDLESVHERLAAAVATRNGAANHSGTDGRCTRQRDGDCRVERRRARIDARGDAHP